MFRLRLGFDLDDVDLDDGEDDDETDDMFDYGDDGKIKRYILYAQLQQLWKRSNTANSIFYLTDDGEVSLDDIDQDGEDEEFDDGGFDYDD